MEIDFNTGHVGKPDPGQAVPRQDVVKPTRQDAAPFESSEALKHKLKDMPLVRAERLHRAKSLVSDLKYPPDEMLVGIANLLAMNIK